MSNIILSLSTCSSSSAFLLFMQNKQFSSLTKEYMDTNVTEGEHFSLQAFQKY